MVTVEKQFPADYEIGTRYDPREIEPRLFRSWEERGYFCAEPSDPREPFTIVIPPPNVTGALHLGHALNNTLQDVLVRFARMSGRATLWLPGTDHAGIATQNVVEKELRREGKRRHDLGREKFLERVWAWKHQNGSRIIEQLKRLGCSCDWRRERFTMDEGLTRAVLEVFVRLYEKGLVYRGEYLVNWCPRCGTALSDEEAIPVETEGALYRIRYPLKEDPSRFLTVATTRPETMLGDTAVAVHPEDERYRALVGKTVVLPLLGREIPVVADDYVDRAFGTGCLKITPAHDLNDFEVGKRHGLPLVNMLEPDGRVSQAGGPYAGLDRFEARKRVLEDLEKQGLFEGKENYRHNVPRCQRCETVLEYYLSKQWFVRMKPLAEPAIRAVREGRVRFFPERWTASYLHWMENVRDWCISRQLWWGHRIPVWYCESAGCEGLYCGRAAPANPCPRCGGSAWRQDPDVLDTWFSSWLWPFSTMGWPERTELLAKFYPTTTLVTAYEIIFFWVARMIMAGLEFVGEVPFRDVYIHGIVRDDLGRKMSKSLGNGIDPIEVIEESSADALRFTLVYLQPEGQDSRVSKAKFEIGRNFATKLWNAARLIFANLQGYEWGDGREAERLVLDPARARPEDRWIISCLQRTNAEVVSAIRSYRLNAAVQALYDFTWGCFCDWWLEIAKPRFYAPAAGGAGTVAGAGTSENGAGAAAAPSAEAAVEKRSAQAVASYVLERLLRLLHPVIPFVTEELWTKLAEVLGGRGFAPSLMVARFPEADLRFVDPEVEARFDLLTSLVRGIRAIRAQFNIPPGKGMRALVTPAGGRGGPRGEPPPRSLSAARGAESLSVVRASAEIVRRLARLDSLEVAPGLAKPHGAAVAVVSDLECFVPLEGLIDLQAERRRLSTQLERVEQQLKTVRRKLEAPGFTERAPSEVVEQTRLKLAELEKQADLLRAHIADLD